MQRLELLIPLPGWDPAASGCHTRHAFPRRNLRQRCFDGCMREPSATAHGQAHRSHWKGERAGLYTRMPVAVAKVVRKKAARQGMSASAYIAALIEQDVHKK